MRWTAVAVMCALGGCGHLLEQRRLEIEREKTEQREAEAGWLAERDRPDIDQLVTRGRFDLACQDVSAVVLDRNNDDGPPTLVGVAGCDKQVQYTRRLRASGWGGRTAENTHWDKVHEPQLVTRVESR